MLMPIMWIHGPDDFKGRNDSPKVTMGVVLDFAAGFI